MLCLKIKRLLVLSVLLVLFLSACSKSIPLSNESWSEEELSILASFRLQNLTSSTHHASNKYANNAQAAAFGKQLFFDKRFSANGEIACATCHDPEKAFTDGLSKAKGIGGANRNTQTVLGTAYATWFYWDGRKDSLWSQALIPFEAPNEMGFTRVGVLRLIGNDAEYRKQYENVFGLFPNEILSSSFPENAGPLANDQEKDQWHRLPLKVQQLINRTYSNIGKAIAAYERSLPLPKTRFDYYLDSLFDNKNRYDRFFLSDAERKGIKLFIDAKKTHCLRCHNGPLLTNNQFHNVETGNFDSQQLDFGRMFGIIAVSQDEFNCWGPYSDASKQDCRGLRFLSKQVHGDSKGAFKTPTLRYLNKTKPYFHDGRIASLNAVIDHYSGIKENTTDLTVLDLSESDKLSLLAFIEMLYE